LTVWIIFSLSLHPSAAQTKLGTVFKKKYSLRSVSCYACHVKGEEKDVLNPFGHKIGKLLEGKNVTKRLKAAKEIEEEEEKEEVIAVIEQEFLEAFKKLEKLKAPSGNTYAEAIRAGEIEGIKLRKKKLDSGEYPTRTE
jgi:hypothetical protein